MAGLNRSVLRTVASASLRVLAAAVLGAIVGLGVALFTPAHAEIAGSDTRIWLQPGRDYDQFGVDSVLTGTRTTTRAVIGEPLGVRAELNFDGSVLTDADGQFNTDILPAYVQAYSDPDQLVTDVRHALVLHLVVFTFIGAGVVALGYGAWRGYRSWRMGYDRTRWPGLDARAVAKAYRAPERRYARRVAVVLVALVVVGAIPSAVASRRAPTRVRGESIFDGTPLAGIKVTGLLRPALVAARSYIETYFDQTNDYYDQLRTKLEAYLATNPVALPTSADAAGENPVVQFGFVTDRHCNIGMDRVIVGLLQHFAVHTLVSGGDDAFSGSFAFEAACTRNLADKTSRAHITDVFVGGNHDSAQTVADEDKQGIKTLTGSIVTAAGLQFIGSPDPRTSRYGQGIVPSARSAQLTLLERQGAAIGRSACSGSAPIIAVLHDPVAGESAIGNGCGHVTLALDGHTHVQRGPTVNAEPTSGRAYQFTGASSGGAPGETSVERSFASQLTVGPLNHDATVNIVSVDRTTGALVGVTEFHFTPDQTITVTQQRVS